MICNITPWYVLWLKSCMCHGQRVIGYLFSINFYIQQNVSGCISLLYILWIMSCFSLQFSLFFALVQAKIQVFVTTDPPLQPSELCYFQLIVGILFHHEKFFWLVCWDILNECCDMTEVRMRIYVWLVVYACLPFWISKYCFWRDMYPKRNKAFSVSPEFFWTQPRAKSAFMWHLLTFLCFGIRLIDFLFSKHSFL